MCAYCAHLCVAKSHGANIYLFGQSLVIADTKLYLSQTRTVSLFLRTSGMKSLKGS